MENIEKLKELFKNKEIYVLGKTLGDFRIGVDEDVLILKSDGTYEYVESEGDSI